MEHMLFNQADKEPKMTVRKVIEADAGFQVPWFMDYKQKKIHGSQNWISMEGLKQARQDLEIETEKKT